MATASRSHRPSRAQAHHRVGRTTATSPNVWSARHPIAGPVDSSWRTAPSAPTITRRRMTGTRVGERVPHVAVGSDTRPSRSDWPSIVPTVSAFSSRKDPGGIVNAARHERLHARLQGGDEEAGIRALARHVAERQPDADSRRAAGSRSSRRRCRAPAGTPPRNRVPRVPPRTSASVAPASARLPAAL